MNTTAIKSKIILLRCIDVTLLLGVFVAGTYFIMHTEYRLLAMLGSLFGLALVNQIGRWTFTEVARLKQDLKQLDRINKNKE